MKRSMKLSEIYEGWRNHLIPPSILKDKIERIHIRRMEVCKICPLNSVNNPQASWLSQMYEHCTECGCPLMQKTKCLSCSCGIKSWKAVLTEKQEEHINSKEDDETD